MSIRKAGPKFELTQISDEELALPDLELGLHLMARWIGTQAQALGMNQDQITAEFAEQVRQSLLKLDTENLDLFPLRDALLHVANGNPDEGGSLFRRHIIHHAGLVRNQWDAETGRKSKQQKKAALKQGPEAAKKKRGQEKKNKQAEVRRVILAIWKNIPHSKKWSAKDLLEHILQPAKLKKYFRAGSPYKGTMLDRAVREELAALRKEKAAS